MITKLFQNPNWNRRTLEGDIALIKLISPVEMNQYVKTIEMHSAGTNLDGADCTISGWGVTTVGKTCFQLLYAYYIVSYYWLNSRDIEIN